MSDKQYKHRFRLEMRIGQDQRQIDADSYAFSDCWMIFYRGNPQGGQPKEFWRVKTDDVVCMETKA
ncbi:hypothetical protein [Sphingopyxis sp. JAI128]|uniref:hypothetical protein n=1 Tax=Sphingopyxis sp. JAI128 TaxID=2723066 RepID=UPI001615B3E6|nr:hypothetical protein [Sphingopyxis sp. JAI128]MBB6424965.1 hypothetical protein [Sphingopyxis sp. JAI128]